MLSQKSPFQERFPSCRRSWHFGAGSGLQCAVSWYLPGPNLGLNEGRVTSLAVKAVTVAVKGFLGRSGGEPTPLTLADTLHSANGSQDDFLLMQMFTAVRWMLLSG